MLRASLLCVATFAVAAITAGGALAGGSGGTTQLIAGGAGTLATSNGTAAVTGPLSTEVPLLQADEAVPNSGNSAARVPSSGVPRPDSQSVTGTGSELINGFQGLNHFDERTAGTGAYANTNFSLEPPDQGLCVGGGKIIENVNTAFRVYNEDGTPAGAVTSYNQFFGLTPPINRTTGVRGAFTSDPKCIYDAPSHRFILTLLEAGQTPAGAFDGTGGVYFAVSAPGSTTSWSTYHFDDSQDGANGTSAGCPCLGDQPLVGADANGIYFAVNSFPFFANGFNGAWIYAVSKSALFNAPSGSITVQRYYGGQLRDGLSYSVQPAISPSTNFATADNGTEYFLSALDFNATLDNQIAEWRLTNTAALGVPGGRPTLQSPALIDSEVYGQPPAAQQSTDGPFPLLDASRIPGPANPLGSINPANFHVELLNSNDDRMNNAIYANGKLWGSLNTVVKTANGPTQTGLAWFAVDPASATMASQGYVSANDASLLYPSLAINDAGKGVIGATIVSKSMHPSTAYALINAATGAGPLHLAFSGPVGSDGFTGYTDPVTGAPVNQRGVERWGDYGAAGVDADGSIWVANETTSLTRTLLANWGTYVSHVKP
jgi:hypothetical protein